MKTVDQIYKELHRELLKLKEMPLGSELTLKQSVVVDGLINEYYRALSTERKVAI